MRLTVPQLNNKYGQLTIDGAPFRNQSIWFVRAKCDCGAIVNVSTLSIKAGNTVSCGCYNRKISGERLKTHGQSRTGENHSLYRRWIGIKTRCYNKNEGGYKYYGGRGISVCDEWRDDFKKFCDWALANGYQKGLQIDRINNDGNYEPSNCRWVSGGENSRNRRTSKLNSEDIPMIKQLSNTTTAAEIGRKYKVTTSHICQIIKNKTWQ